MTYGDLVTRRGATLFLLACGLSSAVLGQSTFVQPHVLERDGGIVDIAWNVRNGQPVVSSSTDSLGRSFIPFSALFSLYGSDEVLQWLCDNANGKKSAGTYAMYSIQKGARTRFDGELEVQEVELPACDAESKDPAGMGSRIRPRQGFWSASESSSFKTASDMAKKQKMWLPSNFRLRMGGLPTGNVRRTLPIKFRISADDDGDGVPESISVSELVFSLPIADAGPFMDAYRATESGEPKEIPFSLEYLDDAGNAMFTLTGVAIVISAAPENMFLDPLDSETEIQVVCAYNGHPIILKGTTKGGA